MGKYLDSSFLSLIKAEKIKFTLIFDLFWNARLWKGLFQLSELEQCNLLHEYLHSNES